MTYTFLLVLILEFAPSVVVGLLKSTCLINVLLKCFVYAFFFRRQQQICTIQEEYVWGIRRPRDFPNDLFDLGRMFMLIIESIEPFPIDDHYLAWSTENMAAFNGSN